MTGEYAVRNSERAEFKWKSGGIVDLNPRNKKYKNIAMNDLDASAFCQLFLQAYQKCFGHPMIETLSETESKLFSSKIFDQTGLVIGSKSIKNYSSYVLSPNSKEENPSVATLDTFARFVLNAPYTDEIQRKNKASHYPYWFQFKNSFYKSHRPKTRKKQFVAIAWSVASVVLLLLLILFLLPNQKQRLFSDSFHSLAEDSLKQRGWFIQSKNEQYWTKRNEHPGYLTLYTLKGDNWPDSVNRPNIQNLLLRKISGDCFAVEIHLSEFFPLQNWQQAGILLLEDTNFTGRSLRLSLSYNDFYGGFPKEKEVIIQAITSQGKNFDKPEELAHQLIYKLDSTNEELVEENLQHSALRVEKQGKRIRLLYSNGSMANSAFKEILSREIEIGPKFIGLFALRGFVDNATSMPAMFDFFSYTPEQCGR